MTDVLLWLIDNTGSAAGYIVVGLILAAGAVGGVAGLVKNRLEIQSLKEQIIDSVAKHEERIQESSRRYNDATVLCGQLAAQLIAGVKAGNNQVQLDSIREAFYTCLTDRTIPAMLDLFSWQRIELDAYSVSAENQANPDDYAASLTDTIDELHRLREWLNIVNHPTLLQHLRKSPQFIQKRTFQRFLTNVRRFPRTIRNVQFRRANEAVAQITASSTKSQS